jgi:hypothetical protein
MSYRRFLRKIDGGDVSEEEENNLRAWIQEYTKIDNHLMIEKYYVGYTAYHQRNTDHKRVIEEFKKMATLEYIQRYSFFNYVHPIYAFIYDKEEFLDDFPDFYEETLENN